MVETYSSRTDLATSLIGQALHITETMVDADAHVAYYAPCMARFADSRTTGAPLLMLYGGRDQLIHPDRCAEIARDSRGGGSAVTSIEYLSAVQQWDGEMQPRLTGRHLADCRFRVDQYGIVHDVGSGYAMSGWLMRGLVLAACTGSAPWQIGRSEAVVARSNADLLRFLARVLDDPALAP